MANIEDIGISTFRSFCKGFLPFYMNLFVKNDSDIGVGELSKLRVALSGLFKAECDMLTDPFLNFMLPFLDELGIKLMFDKDISPRNDSVAFSRTECLIDEGKRLVFRHYLLEDDKWKAKVYCTDCKGYSRGICVDVCMLTPNPRPAWRCDFFEPKE